MWFGHLWIKAMAKYLLIFGVISVIGCSDSQEAKRPLKPTYVPPTINYKGQYRKGMLENQLAPGLMRLKTKLSQGITTRPEGSIGERISKSRPILQNEKVGYQTIK